MKTIKATNETIKEIVNSEIKILGIKADLNHIDVSEVKDMLKLFNESNFNGDISNWDVYKVKNIWMECSKSPNLMAILASGMYPAYQI